ncbi:hypothetical protein [Campylobacter troglodytis]|uniref:hypothetical protein n=1 Tax=Campylobacter troglodytis TaxID=654363 RepID=UPI00115746DE|nr:hypothetical protein [Campylobacter troglodytis]TQR51038.1 hypothetical protein DMC01_12735 [Campylobacter troglodytis]
MLDDEALKIKKLLLNKLPNKNHTHTNSVISEWTEKYIIIYQWKDRKTLEIHIQHLDDCIYDYYTFFDLDGGVVKIMRNQETC